MTMARAINALLTGLNAAFKVLRMDALTAAFNVVGTQAALADRLGVHPMTVSQWKHRGVTADQVIPIVKATNGVVTPNQLRPDIYPDPEWLPPGIEPRKPPRTQ